MISAVGRSICLGAGAVLALDQASKYLVLAWLRPNVYLDVIPFLSLRLGFNTGVSFGMFATDANTFRIPLIVVTLIIIAILIVVAMRSAPFERGAVSAIIGGAAGNLADRVFRGKVTDYIDIHVAGWHWPSFNFADSAITVGVLALLWSSLSKDERKTEGYR